MWDFARILFGSSSVHSVKASKAGMYADDTQVSLASSSVDELVRKAQDELSNISEWMSE